MSLYYNYNTFDETFDMNEKAMYYTSVQQDASLGNSLQTTYDTNLLYNTEIPAFQYSESALQDDNFSIATASDLYTVNQQFSAPSPSLLSVGDMTTTVQQLTPNSTPSPQLSEFNYTMNEPVYHHHQRNISYDSFFFAPVIPSNNPPPKRRVSSTFVPEKRHICPVCNHRSKRRHNLVEHMLTHNPHRPKSFLCSHCSRPFARKYDMKRHEKIHLRK